jgi:hypothetical protein
VIHEGTFEVADRDPAPLTGPGSLTIMPHGVRLQAMVARTGLAAGLSVAIAMVATAIAVSVAMHFLDATTGIGDESSLRPAVAVGAAVLIGGFLASRGLLARSLPFRPVDRVIDLRHVVSGCVVSGRAASGRADVARLHLVCSAPGIEGRIVFRTVDADGALRGLERVKR